MCINCGFANALGAFMTDRFPKDIDRRRFMQASLACVGVGASSLSLSSAAFGTTDAADHASVIFRNGKVYTLDARKPWAQAVAVKNDKIAAVGSDADALALAGPGTKVIDLAGRMLMPGFVESHIHPFLGAFMTAGVDLQVPTAKDAIAAIAAFAKTHPTGTIRGFGWRVDMFPPEGPTRDMLDAVITDRPAFFLAIDAHSLWANSKALETAKIDAHTPDPVPGFSYYVRDSSGRPTGYVMETSALLEVVNGIEPISLDSMAKLLVDWLPKASAAGITSVFDAGVPPIGADQGAILEIYTELEKQGRLPFRVVGSYLLKAPPVEAAIASTQELMRRIDTDLVQAPILKMLGDGTPGGYTAWLTEPYADKPDSIGSSPFSEAQWKSLILEADRAGLDVHIHACGERAAHVGLDAFEAAIAANGPRDRRHAIAHNVLTDDVDIPRFGKLGVIAQFSANWLSADPDTVDTLTRLYGPARQSMVYRPKSILARGGSVTFGSDWPAAGYVSTYKPLDSIQVAVTRQLVGKPDAPVLAPTAERMDLAEAIRAATLAGARQLRLEDKVGSVEPGKRADLIVLGKNLFEVSPSDIASVPVELTMMNGQFTHGG